ncbi:hypothetical protein [Methylobacterium variabile]|nr:hypothetical protein [Methylobacterium variabile]
MRRKALDALRPAMASKSLVLALDDLDDTTEAAEIIDAYFGE